MCSLAASSPFPFQGLPGVALTSRGPLALCRILPVISVWQTTTLGFQNFRAFGALMISHSQPPVPKVLLAGGLRKTIVMGGGYLSPRLHLADVQAHLSSGEAGRWPRDESAR